MKLNHFMMLINLIRPIAERSGANPAETFARGSFLSRYKYSMLETVFMQLLQHRARFRRLFVAAFIRGCGSMPHVLLVEE